MKILLNRTYDNFTMSQKAIARYNELAGTDYRRFDYIGENILEEFERGKEFEKEYNEILECKYNSCNIVINGDNYEDWIYLDKIIPRNDKHLLQVFEELGEEFLAENENHELEIVDIPDNVDYNIISQDWCGERVKYIICEIDGYVATRVFSSFEYDNLTEDLKYGNCDIFDVISTINEAIKDNPKLLQTKEIYV